MPRPAPPPLSLALIHLRTARGYSQTELAAAAGVRRKLVGSYEGGTVKILSRETLDVLAAAMGYEAGEVDLVLLFLRGLSPGAPAPAAAGRSPIEPSRGERQRVARAAARIGLLAASLTRSRLLEAARVRRLAAARREAARLWEELRQMAPTARRDRVETSPEHQTWALAERLCDESVRAAAADGQRAEELARLALRAAELAPGEPAWRSRLLGWVWAFVGNAQRVRGHLQAAGKSFAAASECWRAGAAAADSPLAEWRLLDLEASLRRELGEFEQALDLLGRALAAAPAAARGRILLNRAVTLEYQGEIDAALAVLREAAPLIEAAREPRDRLVVRFNGIVILCHLGRHQEAEAQLPELRNKIVELGNELDLLRHGWLSARVAAGLGKREAARVAFEEVRRQFAQAGNPYDTALVSLELSMLELEEGHLGEVRALAEAMLWIFSSQQVHREALAALRLYCRAAANDTATAALARRLFDYLERARRDPGLRFEAQATDAS